MTQSSVTDNTIPISTEDTSVETDLRQLEHKYLKDGRLYYKETKLRPETHPLIAAAILSFRSYRQTLEQSDFTISLDFDNLPESHSQLIGMLAQDSDETLPVLANRLNDLLSPFMRNEQVADIFLGAIEQKIRSVATRQKYGLSSSLSNQTETLPTSIPAHLTLSRWETTDLSYSPIDFQDVVLERREQRKEMSTLLLQHYHSLPPHLQHHLLHSKPRKSQPISMEEKAKSNEELALELEKSRKKMEERKKKEEEKQKREQEKLEERQKREQEKLERQKREEEKLEEKRRREEDKKKKEQSQLRLTSLFTKNVDGNSTPIIENDHLVESKSMFPPFFIKDHVNMYMVASIQKMQSDLTHLITSYSTDPNAKPYDSDELRHRYLKELNERQPKLTRRRRIKRKVDLKQLLLPGSSGSNLDSIHRPEIKSLLKMKLLQFTEDVRPAYYGTWTKLSNSISPKNPFTKDTELIDYEHDSEAEWEPEGEGDDIQSGEEDEDDIVPEGNDPEDVGWLVPEGYLSEGEGVNDSDEDGMSKIVQRLSVRPKSRKNIASRPIIIGPIFENDDDMDQNEPLKPFGIRMLFDSNNNSNGYDPFAIIEKKSNSTDNNGSNNKTNGFTSEHAEALINIIQGKVDGMTKLVTEAKANSLLCEFPKTQIEAKIRDIAIKEKRGNDTKSAWYAKTQVKNLPS